MATYRITNPKGEVRTNLTREQVEEFKASKLKQGVDPKAAGYVVEEEPETLAEKPYGRTSLQQRRDYFGGGVAGTLAEIFPNLAEQYMQGNDSYNLGTLNAGISDVLSYPGRLIMAIGNSKDENDKEGFNLGRRSSDVGGSGFGNTTRNPAFSLGLISAPLMGETAVASSVWPNIGKGAALGASFGGAEASLNNRSPKVSDYVLGGFLGGSLEGVSPAARLALQKLKDYSFARKEDLKLAVASALELGNTKQMLTKERYDAFMANPSKKEIFDEAMAVVDSWGNVNPLKTDKGKGLVPLEENSRKEVASLLEGEPALKQGASEAIDPNLSVTERDLQRRANIANDPNTEPYQLKTIYKPGKHDITDDIYQREFSEPRLFEAKPKNTKDPYYQSNVEYNIEKFAEKYLNIDSQFLGVRIDPNKKQMTLDEGEFLFDLEREIANDHSILAGYNPKSGTYDLNKVLQSNKFLGDRVPFNQSFYDERVEPFIHEHNKYGFSREFYDAVRGVLGELHNFGRNTKNNFREAFSGKERSVLERAFAYAKDGNISVKKGTRDAFDRFADSLSDYADESVGQLRMNSKGEQYIVDKEKSAKYAFTYLKKIQDELEKNMAISPDTVIGLYSDATLHNDKEVQKAVLQLLRDLKVDKSIIDKFETIGQKYTMFKKARIKLNKNAKDDANPFKGTIAAPIYPQEGVNPTNIVGYKVSNAIDGLPEVKDKLAGQRNPEIPWNLGDIMRLNAYTQFGNNR